MVVIVTGANGQLGQSLQYVAPIYPQIEFVFCDSTHLDITNIASIEAVFEQKKPAFCINAAAYTAVDKAETEIEKATNINVFGVQNLAKTCLKHHCVLLHISTDFVFDGDANIPYSENDFTNPKSSYGQTKLMGEKAIQNLLPQHYIVRTSWVYSQFGHNFMKTMLRLGTEKSSLSIVDDQIGTPTNAVDLANVLICMVLKPSAPFGIYHFSNEGQCSWYDFAKKIMENNKIEIVLNPIKSESYPTPAVRPKYSVLNKNKIKNTLGIEILDWETSLKTIKKHN